MKSKINRFSCGEEAMEEAVCTQEQLYCLQNKAINVQ